MRKVGPASPAHAKAFPKMTTEKKAGDSDRRGGSNGNGKREQLREAALAAASRLFIQRGYGGTNMKEIAEALGISRPTLYYYFDSKEAILSSLVERIMVVGTRL